MEFNMQLIDFPLMPTVKIIRLVKVKKYCVEWKYFHIKSSQWEHLKTLQPRASLDRRFTKQSGWDWSEI